MSQGGEISDAPNAALASSRLSAIFPSGPSHGPDDLGCHDPRPRHSTVGLPRAQNAIKVRDVALNMLLAI
jgi:hypothetical protein